MSAGADGLGLLIDRGDPEETPTPRRHLPVVVRSELPPKLPHSRRGTTISVRRLGKREMARLSALYPPTDEERPRTRGECVGGERPCPWVGCSRHLAIDVNPRTGNIKVTFPDANGWPDLDAMPETCSLDVADRGGNAPDSDGVTLEVLAALLGITRERSRQLEDAAFAKLRASEPELFAALLDAIGVQVPNDPTARLSERAMCSAEPARTLSEMTTTSGGRE